MLEDKTKQHLSHYCIRGELLAQLSTKVENLETNQERFYEDMKDLKKWIRGVMLAVIMTLGAVILNILIAASSNGSGIITSLRGFILNGWG